MPKRGKEDRKMFCVHCGKQLADGFSFCPHCGGKVVEIPKEAASEPAAVSAQSSPAPVQPSPASTNPAPAVTYQAPQRPTPPPHPVPPPANTTTLKKEIFRKQWRTFVSSPLVLMAIICFTAVQVISFFTMNSTLGAYSGVMDLIELMFGVLGIGNNSSQTILQLLIMTPSILTIVGLWLTYADASNQSIRPIKTTGLRIIHILYIVLLVIICIVALVGLFTLIGLLGKLDGNEHLEGMKSVISGTILKFVIAMGCSIALVVLEVCVLKNAVDCAEFCITNTGYITALSVCLYIGAGLSILGLLTAGFTVMNLLSVVNIVLFAVVVMKYKECLETISYMQKNVLNTPKPGMR